MSLPAFKFGIICDCQYSDADSNVSEGGAQKVAYGTEGKHVMIARDRQYRQSLAKLDRAIAEFNAQQVDFVFHLGDLADRSIADYGPIRQSLSGAATPIHQVIGNRDYIACDHDTATACRELGLDAPYYSFVRDNTRFIVLNSNELGIIDNQPGSPDRQRGEDYLESLRQQNIIYAHPSNGGIGDQQYQWLAGQLDEASARGQSIIVLSHHPLFPQNIHNMLNSEKILDLLSRYDITAFMNGHNHAGNYGVKNNTPYITFPGLVEGQSDAYSIASVADGRIKITGYGTHGDYSFEQKFA